MQHAVADVAQPLLHLLHAHGELVLQAGHLCVVWLWCCCWCARVLLHAAGGPQAAWRTAAAAPLCEGVLRCGRHLLLQLPQLRRQRVQARRVGLLPWQLLLLAVQPALVTGGAACEAAGHLHARHASRACVLLLALQQGVTQASELVEVIRVQQSAAM
jgi:hypothetical protein